MVIPQYLLKFNQPSLIYLFDVKRHFHIDSKERVGGRVCETVL